MINTESEVQDERERPRLNDVHKVSRVRIEYVAAHSLVPLPNVWHRKACGRRTPLTVLAGSLVGGDRDSPTAPLPADGDAFWFRGLALGQP